ncbi:hypothetical protein [Neorhodopirellula pilleata]|nr:hypothetical protein [Neorhodopirellula pilleata]
MPMAATEIPRTDKAIIHNQLRFTLLVFLALLTPLVSLVTVVGLVPD